MQTSIRSTTDSTQRGDLPRTENDGGNSWKRLRSSLGLARDDDDDDPVYAYATRCTDYRRRREELRMRHRLEVTVGSEMNAVHGCGEEE